MKRILRTAALLIGVSALALSASETVLPAGGLQSWRVAFVRGGNLWVCNGDGTDQKMIIEGGQRPAWSPDRSRIAFVRGGALWLAMADGSKQHPVTFQWTKPETVRDPDYPDVDISWHPSDGSIAFSRAELFKAERMGGTAGIVLARNGDRGVIEGSTIFEIRPKGPDPGRSAVRYDIFASGTGYSFSNHGNPAWSPTGLKLAFTRNGDIWVSEAVSSSRGEPPSGWKAKRLAAVAVFDEPTNRASRQNAGATRLSWHPDGRRLVYGFDRLQGSGFNEVHLLDTSSRSDTVVVRDALEPCLSPDGNFILYRGYGEACGSDGSCVCAVSLDGKLRTKILSGGSQPVW
jgi:Tol biopolymer transport system component